jgi:hypothetical protein
MLFLFFDYYTVRCSFHPENAASYNSETSETWYNNPRTKLTRNLIFILDVQIVEITVLVVYFMDIICARTKFRNAGRTASDSLNTGIKLRWIGQLQVPTVCPCGWRIRTLYWLAKWVGVSQSQCTFGDQEKRRRTCPELKSKRSIRNQELIFQLPQQTPL